MHSRQGAARPAQPQNTPLTPPPSAFAYLAQQLASAMSRYPGPSPELNRQAHCSHIDCVSVPEEVWIALDLAWPDFPLAGANGRLDIATLLSPLMAIQDWRFCKCYRAGVSAGHRCVYRLVDTVAANAAADQRERAYQAGNIVFIQGSEL